MNDDQSTSQFLALVDIINRPEATLDEIREGFRHQVAPIGEKLKALHTVAESGTGRGNHDILLLLSDMIESLSRDNILEPYRGKISTLLEDGCPDAEVLKRMLWSMHCLYRP